MVDWCYSLDKDVGGSGPRVRGQQDEIEKLIILGPTRGRRIAQLKVSGSDHFWICAHRLR